MTAMLPHPSSDLPDDENLFGPVVRLSTFATELAELPLGPRPAFRAELRARLLAEAHPATPVRSEAEPPRRGRYGKRAAAMGLALALTGGGVAAAAERSLPGEPLYPVKRLGQSVRLALDPGSGVGPSLRLVSARISDVERTIAVDPNGTDAARWNALDSAVGDADNRLVRLTASAPAQQLSAALAPDRARLGRLLPAMPVAHQPALRQLRDTIDGLAASQPVAGGAPLSVDLLPSGHLAPSGPLAAGWPLDPASLQLPSLPVGPRPQLGGTDASTGSTATSRSASGGSTTAGSGSGSGSSAPGASGSSGGPTQTPLGGLSGGGTRSSTSTRVLPRASSGLGTTVDRTVGGTLGTLGGTGTAGTGGTQSGGSRTGPVGDAVNGVVGDATDTVSHLPLINGLTGTTSN